MDYEKLNIAQAHSETDIFTETRYKQFYKHFPDKAKKVLDVGCNTGRGGTVLHALNNNLELSGLDCVQARIDALPPNLYVHKFCLRSTQMKVIQDKFDVIVAGEFIEHLNPSDVKISLKEFYRVLKNKGRLLLTTPNPDYIKLKFTGETVIHGAHLSEHKFKALANQLNDIGFKVKKIIGTGKVSKILGQHFPFINIYGSYMLIADK